MARPAIGTATALRKLKVEKRTSIGRGARVKNKHKRRQTKPYNRQGKPR